MRSKLRAVMLGALVVVAGSLWPLAGAPARAATGLGVTMTYQSTTVEASISGQSLLTLGLAVSGGASEPTVATELYSRLTTRSGLVAALSAAGPTQLIDKTAPLPVRCLPASAHGGAALVLDVVTSATTTPSLLGGCIGSAAAPSLDLRCQVGNGSCNGVYPLAITVSDSGSVTRLVTLMTFVENPAAVPLRVSTVLHLLTTPVAAVASTTKALERNPAVPVDLAIDPTSAQALSTSTSGMTALAALASAVSQSAPTREVLRSPYVTVDPGVLGVSSLSHQLSAQLRRGNQVLTAAGLAPTAPDVWVDTTPVTSSTTPALAAAGIRKLVIPDAALAEPSSTSLTWGQPFSVVPGDPSVTTFSADGILAAQAEGQSDGVLGAMRLLGDLSFLHFERPSLVSPQGVVIIMDPTSSAPSMLSTLLTGLGENSVLAPSTLEALFSQVPAGANGAPTTRRLAQSGPSTAWPVSVSSGITVETDRQAAFASALAPGNPVSDLLGDRLLATQRAALSPGARSTALHSTAMALDDQLRQIAISGADITMTALKSSVPITLTSTAGYTVTGVLSLTSAHLRFTKGSQFVEVLDRPTKSLRIPVEAVTTGDFPLTASLATPRGILVLAHQRILVHATHTSIVAIFLTVGSAIVLLVWWLRTWWRKPRPQAAR